MNLFYKNIALEITEKIEKPINSPDFYLQKAKSPSEPLTLTECTSEEVRMIVMCLASKPSTGPDMISNKMITRNFIEKELSNQKYVCLITIDLKKAFDCIKTNGELQNKIRYYSKSDHITNWFNSYFKDRMQSPTGVMLVLKQSKTTQFLLYKVQKMAQNCSI